MYARGPFTFYKRLNIVLHVRVSVVIRTLRYDSTERKPSAHIFDKDYSGFRFRNKVDAC